MRRTMDLLYNITSFGLTNKTICDTPCLSNYTYEVTRQKGVSAPLAATVDYSSHNPLRGCFCGDQVSSIRGNYVALPCLYSSPEGSNQTLALNRSIYQKIREYEVLDKRKTVTALRAGEDRAILLGLSMVFFSVMMYFVLGITVLRSYSDRVWTDESSCIVMNSTIMWDINCSYSCGAECLKTSRYPCLQVYVSLNSSGKMVRLLHNEETHDRNPECFYVPKCHKDYAATHAIVQNISEHLRSQHTVQCFVDPTDRMDSAILTQIYGRVAVFHSFLWPTCSLIGGTIIIAMVKLTQYLSIMCEQLSHINR